MAKGISFCNKPDNASCSRANDPGKDKGLNGDLDRLPMLTWIMFLKLLDDLEIQREQETKLAYKNPDMPSRHPVAGQAETATELDPLLPVILDRAFKGEL